MKLLTDDVREFMTHGYRRIDNARVVDYLLPDQTELGRATQMAKNVWGDLGKLTGIDVGENYAFLVAGDDHESVMEVLTQTDARPPKTIIEQPVGTMFGMFRYVTGGMIIEDADGQKLGRIERPTSEEDHLKAKQVSLFLIHDAEDALIGNVAAPFGGFEAMPEPSVFDELLSLSYEMDINRVRSSDVLGPNNYPFCRVTVDRALDARWRIVITALPLAIRFGYHQSGVGLSSRLPET